MPARWVLTRIWGEVASYHEYAGGMIGRAGNTLAMNYCSNFAPISGSSYLGGMIGEVGDARKWTIMDGVSLGFATFELASTLVGFVPFAKSWEKAENPC